MNLYKVGKYVLYENNRSMRTDQISDPNVKLLHNLEHLDSYLLGFNKQNLYRLLEDGVSLFVYIEDQKPLGMMCGYRGSCYIRGPGIPLHMDDDSVYWFWIYTLPEARGKNVYTKLKHTFFNYYKDVKRFCALVAFDNKVMRCEMKKIGFYATKLYSFGRMSKLSLVLAKDLQTSKTTVHINFGNKYKYPVI